MRVCHENLRFLREVTRELGPQGHADNWALRPGCALVPIPLALIRSRLALDPPPDTDSPKGDVFPQTDWSIVLRASGRKEGRADEALASLCERYWPPLYAFVRSKGYSREDAEDMVQGFFAKLLRNEDLGTPTPERGRLRTFLLFSMRRFLASERQSRGRVKRGGGVRPLSIDAASADEWCLASPEPDPERAFERNWALTVMEAVHDRLRAEYERKAAGEVFAVLGEYVTPNGGELPYVRLAERLGMSEGSIKVRIFRLRNRFRECLREEVAAGLDDPAELEAELLHLRNVLRSSGGLP